MIVTTLAAPAAEPLKLAEAKDYLRIAYDREDALVSELIAASRSRIKDADVAMIVRTLRVTLDRWPQGTAEKRRFRLPVGPANELVSVKVYNSEGVAGTATDRFALAPGRSAQLVWTSGAFPWPSQRANGIEIDYTAGFGEAPDDVADGLKLAMKRLVAHGHHARDAETLAGKLPEDVAGLIAPWRRVRL